MGFGYPREYNQYESITMTGIFDNGLFRSINLADPVDSTDATNRQWVLNEISTSGGTPAGGDTEIQFNIGDSFTSSSNLKWVESVFPDGRLELGGGIQLHERDGGSDHVTILAANAMTGTYDIILPVDAPSVDNQALVSTTAGVTSWQTISGGGGGGGVTEVVVDPSGNGDYTTLAAAITANETNILMVAGTHTISSTISLNENTLIQGQDRDTTILNVLDTFFLTINTGVAVYFTGTVSLTRGSTTVTGVGTDFTSIGAITGSLFMIINDNWYEIDTIDSATTLTLVDTYQGIDASGESTIIFEAVKNISIKNLSIVTAQSVTNSPLQLSRCVRPQIHNIIIDGPYSLSMNTVFLPRISECLFKNSSNFLFLSAIIGGEIMNCEFSNMAATGTNIIQFSNSTNVSVHDCYFMNIFALNCVSAGISSTDIKIVSNYFENLSGGAIGLLDVPRGIVSHNNIKNAVSGVSIGACFNNVISNNIFDTVTAIAISISVGGTHTVNSNIFETVGQGIVNSTNYCIISSSKINTCTGIGIEIDADNCQITDSQIVNCTGNGIDITGDRNVISNNQSRNNTGTGIIVNLAGSDNNLIANNIVFGNTAAQITDNGTGTVLDNNVIT